MNILLTSAGRRSYLVEYFKDALKGTGKVFVANSQDKVASIVYADDYVITPIIYSDEYIPFLLSYCKEKSIDAIIPLFDIDLYVLACHKKDFADIGATVIVSEPDFVSVCNDKWNTYRYLRDNEFNTPKTYLTVDSALKALDSGEISYPVMVKPRWGMASIGVNKAVNRAELEVFTQRALRSIKKTYLKYESAADIDNCVLIQELIEGDEYGLDVINDLDGNYRNTSVKKKLLMRAGETDAAQTVDCSGLRELGEKLGRLSHHTANMDVDAFSVNGVLYVLEMNVRFGGGYPFSHIAGVNLPLAIIKWLSNESVSDELLTPKIGVLGQKDISMLVIDDSRTKNGDFD